jgi:hypothetical protein
MCGCGMGVIFESFTSLRLSHMLWPFSYLVPICVNGCQMMFALAVYTYLYLVCILCTVLVYMTMQSYPGWGFTNLSSLIHVCVADSGVPWPVLAHLEFIPTFMTVKLVPGGSCYP